MTINDKIIEISDEGSLHHYRTEIPNIIFDLDLTHGEFKFYCYLKKVAGDHGSCWKGLPKLIEESGLSERFIRDCKKKFSQPFPKLDGSPLINITKRKKKDGSDDTDLITLKDIWKVNFQIFSSPAMNAGGVGHSVPGGGALIAPKEDPFNKNPIKKEKVKEKKSSFGPDGFVKLTEIEYNKLFIEWGKSKLETLVEQLNDYIASTGKSYKSHYHTLKLWYRRGENFQSSKFSTDRRTKNVDGSAVVSPADGLF